jgi:hypothetical protein
MAAIYQTGEFTNHSSGSDCDVIAPLKRESLLLTAHDGTFLDAAPLVQKSAYRKPVPMKKGGTVSMLQRQATKADIKIKQREHIERKSQLSKRHTVEERVAYKVDQYISTRTGQTMSLALVGLVLIVIGACVLKASQPSQDFREMVWQSWTFLGDPGSHTTLTEAGVRVIGVVMTLTGILYFSVIMGFVVDGIRDKMDSLKKGKSKVAEDKHTVRPEQLQTGAPSTLIPWWCGGDFFSYSSCLDGPINRSL